MQPYFAPYIGYWQLLNYVDEFIVYDDVNFIKRGWINRNILSYGGEEHYATVPLLRASQNKKINEITLEPNARWREKLLKTLSRSFARARYLDDGLEVAEAIVSYESSRLDDFLMNQIRVVSAYLKIKTKILSSAQSFENQSLTGESRILDICKQRGANTYINAIGGKQLYSQVEFARNEIGLLFLRSRFSDRLRQITQDCPHCSLLQLVCVLGREELRQELDEFTIEQ